MSLFQDLRFAGRMLAKDPGFTGVVIVTLALGIGANTTVFTLANAVLFKGLPYEKPDRVMHLSSTELARNQNRVQLSYPDFADWRARTKTFQGLAAFRQQDAVLNDPGGLPERYRSARISTNCFSLIGQKPILGRDFLPEEDLRTASPVVILGYSLWKNRYGGDSAILGRALRINEVSTVVVGVMPDQMKFPGEADLWLPLVPTGNFEKRDSRSLNVFGRLTPGATRADASAEMSVLAKSLEKEYPKSNAGFGAVVVPFSDFVNGGSIRTIFVALLGAVGFVLLIACANVANLLLSRSLSRAKEISIRAALGASRVRVVRQLLVESVLMGLIGGALALPLSMWGVRAFDLAVANTGKPSWIKFEMDYVVFAYLAAVCVITGILFGLAPALHISKLDVNHTLKEGGRSGSSGSRIKYMSGLMVVSQVALTIVLMAGAGLMIRSFLKMYSLDAGMNTNDMLIMRFNLPDQKYKTPEARIAFGERLLPRLQSIAGVESVSLTSNIPLGGAGSWQFEQEGHAPVEKDKLPRLSGVVVTPEYFETVGVRVSRGRTFETADGSAGKANAIVNQSLAAKYWPGQDPLGKRIRLVRDTEQPWLTVVGVIPDIVQNDPTRTDPNTILYIPFRQDPLRGTCILARTRVPPNSLIAAFRTEVRNVDEDLPVFEAKALAQEIIDRRWPFRVFGTLFAVFALIGLALSAVGIYAVVAYSVSLRTQEIGIRMALGASPGSVLRLVLSLGLAQLAIGLAIGLGMSFAVTRVLKAVLAQISPTDPLTFAAISALLLVVGGYACWSPARKATKIDPLIALRYE